MAAMPAPESLAILATRAVSSRPGIGTLITSAVEKRNFPVVMGTVLFITAFYLAVVTLADLGLVNAQIAQFVTAANYLMDVNVSGTLSLADKGMANAQVTRALPAP